MTEQTPGTHCTNMFYLGAKKGLSKELIELSKLTKTIPLWIVDKRTI